MTEWVRIIPELLKLAPGLMFPIAIVSAFLLFNPGSILSASDVKLYVEPYRVFILATWIMSTFVSLWYGIRPAVRDSWKSSRNKAEAFQRQIAETKASKTHLRKTLLALHVSEQQAFMTIRNAPKGLCWFPRWNPDLDRLLGLGLVSKVVPEHGMNSDSAVHIEPKLAAILAAYPELLDDLPTEKHPQARYDEPRPERQTFV